MFFRRTLYSLSVSWHKKFGLIKDQNRIVFQAHGPGQFVQDLAFARVNFETDALGAQHTHYRAVRIVAFVGDYVERQAIIVQSWAALEYDFTILSGQHILPVSLRVRVDEEHVFTPFMEGVHPGGSSFPECLVDFLPPGIRADFLLSVSKWHVGGLSR